ncbi:MAG: hypothetical protein WC661_10290 [Opitutaceae bacterium]|jgi:hypothetical protein
MKSNYEIANLNRAALVAVKEWGINDPRTKAIRSRIETLRANRSAVSETGNGAPVVGFTLVSSALSTSSL